MLNILFLTLCMLVVAIVHGIFEAKCVYELDDERVYHLKEQCQYTHSIAYELSVVGWRERALFLFLCLSFSMLAALCTTHDPAFAPYTTRLAYMCECEYTLWSRAVVLVVVVGCIGS